MDRNTIIGFVLLAGLLFAYLFISTKNTHELEAKKKAVEDSIARVELAKKRAEAAADTTHTLTVASADSGFNSATAVTEQLVTLENELVKVVLTSKGGIPKTVELKKYNSFHNEPVKLVDGDKDVISYSVNANNAGKQTTDLYFKPGQVTKAADGSQTVSFVVNGGNGETITHQYSLKPDSYFIDFNIGLQGADKLLSQNSFNLLWQTQLVQQEKDLDYEKQQAQLCFVQDGDFDYHNIHSTDIKKFEKPINWLSAKQHFFNTTIIAKNNFDGGQVDWASPTSDTVKELSLVKASFNTKVAPGPTANIPLQLYYGPNDYKILRNSGVKKMDKIINLGQSLYAFVRPINQYIIMPVFDFFKGFVASYGVVILLLTLFIRLLTSPLVYSSYLSGAKMKALRPEIDVIRKKYGDDQQQFGMEQMKLFREAGVNPLGGCIPALLQIPIFFALYSFFNSNIALRGQSFLWAKDLSVYDTIISFGVKIPLLGDHISLFTLLAVITSFLISLYGMSNTPDQNNPALKYMPYIFPFMLLFIFNKLPSALTWYYTVSNVITLILQFVIQNYIINHEKILAKLEENRKKPKSKSKWQERMEQMQESQKRVQEMQQKNKGK
jgi:YidC/Oxa1 family membrane protein insertase